MYVPRTSHLPKGLVPRLLLMRSEEVVQVYRFHIHMLCLLPISVMIIGVMRLSYNKRTIVLVPSLVQWVDEPPQTHVKLSIITIISCVPFSKHNTNDNSRKSSKTSWDNWCSYLQKEIRSVKAHKSAATNGEACRESERT